MIPDIDRLAYKLTRAAQNSRLSSGRCSATRLLKKAWLFSQTCANLDLGLAAWHKMLALEFKVRAKTKQYRAINEAIRTAQFVQNKCLRYWIDNQGLERYDLNKYCRVLAHEFSFAEQLNSQARQSSAERAWSAISRFYENCKKQIPGKKGYPKFKKNCRSVEYKTTG